MKKLILMMGGQGSGKGTMSKKLITEHGYKYVEAGGILRALPSTSPLREIIERGELVPDADLYELLKANIDTNSDTILDGFPRTTEQAQWLIENFAGKFNIIVVYLNLPRDLMMKRIQNRIAEGAGRADDADTAAVQRRLDVFFSKTLPTIDWLRTVPNIKFLDIPIADAPIEQNYNTMHTALMKA